MKSIDWASVCNVIIVYVLSSNLYSPISCQFCVCVSFRLCICHAHGTWLYKWVASLFRTHCQCTSVRWFCFFNIFLLLFDDYNWASAWHRLNCRHLVWGKKRDEEGGKEKEKERRRETIRNSEERKKKVNKRINWLTNRQRKANIKCLMSSKCLDSRYQRTLQQSIQSHWLYAKYQRLR